MEGILLASSSGKLILQSTFQSPSLPLTALDALNSNPKPLIWIPLLSFSSLATDSQDSDESGEDEDEHEDGWGRRDSIDKAREVMRRTRDDRPGALGLGSVVCHITRGDVRIVVCVKDNIEPSIPFVFLEDMAHLLENYCGTTLTETRIKDSFDVIYELFEEVIHGGIPLTTEYSSLKDLITPSHALSKMLSAASVAGLPPLVQSSNPSSSILSSPIPWRRIGIKYTQNEIFVDIVENLEGIIDRNGKFVSGNITGTIQVNSKLSGMPDLLLTFADSSLLQDPSFHSCVRYQRWVKERFLSFVPPDGNFVLMTYTYLRPSFLALHSLGPTGLLPNGAGVFPLRITGSKTVGPSGGSFDITLASRFAPSVNITNVQVVFLLGEETESVQATTIGGSSAVFEGDRTNGQKRHLLPEKIRWEYDHSSRVVKWDLPLVSATDRPASFRGTWEGPSNVSSSFSVRFSVPQLNVSNVKVQGLKLTNEGYNVYKGLKYASEVAVDVRW